MCPLVGPFWRILVAWLIIGWHSESYAVATITFSQVGNDVQASITGTIDTSAGLTSDGASSVSPNARVRGGGPGANLIIGPTSFTDATSYGSISGPTTIGTSTGQNYASTGSISGPFGINMATSRLILPNGFISGSVVSGSVTWAGSSICSLGLTPGTYDYTWTSDSIRVVIPATGACVPTLSEWSQILLELMVMTLLGWHFQRQRFN